MEDTFANYPVKKIEQKLFSAADLGKNVPFVIDPNTGEVYIVNMDRLKELDIETWKAFQEE